VALNGDGFFRLQGPQGDLYTRDGSFQIQPDGQLVTSDGLPVLGTGGPISLPVEVSQNLIRIGTDGQILADGQVAGNLDIVSFEDNKQLTQTGPTRFRADPSAVSRPSDSMVQQGYLEMSNTSAVTEMISMIIGMRHFEAAQQSLRSISEAIRQHATMGMS
jgi:flagellar basal body rod protein FlgG